MARKSLIYHSVVTFFGLLLLLAETTHANHFIPTRFSGPVRIESLQTCRERLMTSGEHFYQVTRMLPKYVGEENGTSEEQRLAQEAQARTVTTGDNPDIKSIDVEYVAAKDLKDYVFHTDSNWISSEYGNGRMSLMFVMDWSGQIYATRALPRFKHSSFLRGAPVAAAGNFTIENGKIVAIDNLSGHYMPRPWFLKQFIDELARRRVDISQIRVHLYEHDKQFGPARCNFPELFADQIRTVIARTDSSFKDFVPRAAERTLAPDVALETADVLLRDYGVLSQGPVGAKALTSLIDTWSHQRTARGNTIQQFDQLEKLILAGAMPMSDEIQRKLLHDATAFLNNQGCNLPDPEARSKCELTLRVLSLRRFSPRLRDEVRAIQAGVPRTPDTDWIHSLLDRLIPRSVTTD